MRISDWSSDVCSSDLVVQNSIDNIEACDIVIVPSVWLSPSGWDSGRYPRVVAWLKQVHARGAVLCSACSGIFLLAESGLFDQSNATVHFGYARQFAALYPDVSIRPERSEERRGGEGYVSKCRSRWSQYH